MQTPNPGAPDPKPTPNIPDPKSLILPTKEVHSLDSAERVSAAELLKQEQEAKPEKGPSLPPIPPPERKRDDLVEPLQTFQSDMARYVKDANVSEVTIATARHTPARVMPQEEVQGATQPAAERRSWGLYIALMSLAFVLLLLGGGAIMYVYLHAQALPVQQAQTAPFITVDAITPVPLDLADAGHWMPTLVSAKKQVALSVGLIAQLEPVVATTSGEVPLDAQTFVATLAPDVPRELLRTLGPQYLLGVHSFANNIPFLLLSTDSYQSAYAGMLAWEGTLQSDLLPLFAPQQVVHSNPVQTTVSTTTASSTVAQTAPAQFASSNFVDKIIENHDARALVNQYGDVQIVWLFLDRSTLLITTDPNTVKEIISRIKAASTISLPQ